jgi:hypothetical protein
VCVKCPQIAARRVQTRTLAEERGQYVAASCSASSR